jgi:hypothetical protein
MKLIKNYECEREPTKEEISLGKRIADKEDCIVNLKWFVRYSGWYNIRIEKGTTFDECMEQVPKCYPA